MRPLPLPGVLAGRYEIECLLGQGGMASVYLARDRKHDRRVAVKILDAELSRTLGAERFLREIGIAAKLTHPHILPLHDSGHEGEVLYYVMPYVEGETLRSRLEREGQLPLDDALRIACEVASALEYAHRRQIMHRDVKPENILLEEGHAVLADFGIARAVSAAGDRLTQTGMAIGTPAYMSPEQASGAAMVDHRSDVYSLACTLYEMLAGEPPFTGPTAMSITAKKLSEPAPRIRIVRPSVPESVERTLLRALDPAPADRFATAESLRDALAACAREPVRRPWMAIPRRTLLRAGIVAGLAALAAGWVLRARLAGASPLTTVAVLPFANGSSDSSDAYLADGLADALIADLVRVPGVQVISRMSAMRYAGGMDGAMATMMGGMSYMGGSPGAGSEASGATGPTPAPAMSAPKPLDVIARELNAQILMRGTLASVADSVRVSVSLIRSKSLKPIWRASYTRHLRDVFLLQRDLASDVARVVARGDATDAVPARASREYDPAAHEAYLKGSYYQAHWKLPQALAAFERAVQLDSTHAPAQASLARVYYFLAFFGDLPPSVALAGMRRAATAALAQDSLIADAHAQLALVNMLQDWDWEGAERRFRRALEISPGHAQIRHDYAHFLLGQGRQRESMEQAQRAVALDPVNPMLISCLGWHSLFDARFEEAVHFALEANAMMPDHWAQVVLGWARLGQGKPDSALLAFRQAARLKAGAFTLAALGYALAVTGHETEARGVLDMLRERVEREYVSAYDIATVHAGLGDADGAFRWLRRAAEERSTFIVHAGWDSRLDRIRHDPRFADLAIRELRLPAPQFAMQSAGERRQAFSR